MSGDSLERRKSETYHRWRVGVGVARVGELSDICYQRGQGSAEKGQSVSRSTMGSTGGR
jgi:hypothetical protein